ncbi:GNAT family N-acetyltransferase [Planctomycetota bacterium]
MPEKTHEVRVVKATTSQQRESAYRVRRTVFVGEQDVPPDLEFDEFEDGSTHFIATDGSGKACGAARWRITDGRVKLERFAVLASHRRQQIGSALVQAVLDDIQADARAQALRLYLNAQIDAVPFYARFGFQPCGEVFMEADILHQPMERLG